MIPASPLAICCAPSATARRPLPHNWLTPKAVFSWGTPAFIAAWRAGFWPCAAQRICPRMTSSTSAASTCAALSAALIAAAPNSCAGVSAKAPLKAPTAVRFALTMTISDADMRRSLKENRDGAEIGLERCSLCDSSTRPPSGDASGQSKEERRRDARRRADFRRIWAYLAKMSRLGDCGARKKLFRGR